MVSWVLIVIGLLVLLVALVKFKEVRSHLFYRTIGVVLVIFLASLAYVWIKGGINLTTYQGFLQLGQSYYSWLGSLFNNMGSVTGYAVQHDWGVNSTAAAVDALS